MQFTILLHLLLCQFTFEAFHWIIFCDFIQKSKNSSVKLELTVSLLMMCNFDEKKKEWENIFIVSKSKYYFGIKMMAFNDAHAINVIADLIETVVDFLHSRFSSHSAPKSKVIFHKNRFSFISNCARANEEIKMKLVYRNVVSLNN